MNNLIENGRAKNAFFCKSEPKHCLPSRATEEEIKRDAGGDRQQASPRWDTIDEVQKSIMEILLIPEWRNAMKVKKVTGISIVALAVVVVLGQVGCQKTETPPAGESASAPATKPAAPAAGPAPSTRPAAPAERPAPARTATLAAGTPIKVRATTAISTDSHKAGDSFVASLEEPLVQGNWTISPKGATVEGRVLEADKGGRVKGVAHLSIELTSLKTADGRTVQMATRPITVQARATKGKDAAKIGIGTGVGAAVGAIAGGGKGAAIGGAAGAGAGTAVVLSTRGDAAEIGSETVLNFELRSPLTVMQNK